MALVTDTPITDDSDFEKILGIQNIQALNRAAGNWTPMHKEAVNSLVTKLSATIPVSKITNQSVWREYVITWMAWRIYRQHALDGGDEPSFAKADTYRDDLPGLFKEAHAAMTLDTDGVGGADTRLSRAIPQAMNIDSGGRFTTSRGRGVKYNRSMPGFPQGVKDAGKTDDEHLSGGHGG